MESLILGTEVREQRVNVVHLRTIRLERHSDDVSANNMEYENRQH